MLLSKLQEKSFAHVSHFQTRPIAAQQVIFVIRSIDVVTALRAGIALGVGGDRRGGEHNAEDEGFHRIS